ncbi:NHS-like protein 1 isoform X2 [Aricia agestis]|uniref:NHS-like protein 1 isoform X2 n=1 Tax=Aricia agestis TaxID=91739 RepID=UPI001C20600E|nr:NHS-like protein 1 isoform X2 [Aricia agestis]
MTVARGEDSPERLGGALRRLHYRATRRAHSAANRHHTSSKVAAMTSSTTSDKTINTSTDSAATALTSVTGTDDSMDAEPEPPACLMDEPPPPPPATAPPSYHRARASCDYDAPAHPHSAAAAAPARFVFDLPPPDPELPPPPQPPQPPPPQQPPPPPPPEKRNRTQVSQTSGPSTSIQIPFDPKLEQPRSPKANTSKYETHFKFEPEATRRRGSEPRLKNKQKQEYYKEEVAKLRRQLEGTEVFTTSRRRSSTHQHSVPPVSSRRQSTAQVHVTANPLESAASIPSGRTTIVVQQPSLSLDYGGCSTILVRDEDGRRASRQDHIQQLLDVTSQFTSEDLHEFDKRYGSPHHSRSQSVKAARSRTGERQLLGLPQQRARVASMPNTGVEEEYYRLRHFSITGKGVVNRGDSLRSRRSRSNTSVASSASSTEPATRASAPCSLASSRDSSAGLSAYRVLVLGGPGVGKSSLVGQFMTSEYLHAYDTSIDDESGEKSVCVLLAGEESEITFLDEPPDYMVTEGCAHGYCVVYSTADRASFAEAERRLQALWAAGHTSRRAVILVGNKADLARSRVVPTDEGKALATSYECKFIETSVGINHNVDELLVGLLTQIRLKQQHAERARKRSTSRKTRARARSPAAPAEPDPPASAASTPRKRTRLSASVKVRGLLGRVWARDSKSKSCENLHVL